MVSYYFSECHINMRTACDKIVMLKLIRGCLHHNFFSTQKIFYAKMSTRNHAVCTHYIHVNPRTLPPVSTIIPILFMSLLKLIFYEPVCLYKCMLDNSSLHLRFIQAQIVMMDQVRMMVRNYAQCTLITQ